KSIKYFVFGEDDMEKTTTKKIKRNVELDSVRAILEKNKIKIKEAAGRNIDAMKNLLHHDKGAETHDEESAPDKPEEGSGQK
ncbi:MAG: hypothetical protein ACYC5K_02150, partial [Saccharofermentanales bacterium]